MTNGHLELCISKIKDKNNAIQSLSLEDAKNIGTSDIKRFFPNFFDFAIQYKSDIGENDYNIEMYQISPLGRKTGNTANISFSKDGLHYSFMISNNEDPAIVDRAYKISKEKAQEIAYKVCKEEIKTEQIKDADIKICVNKANLTVVKSKQVWVICIKMKNTDHCCTCYNICIDANTGEVLKIVKHL
jgi:predicted small secreted protein